MREGHEHLDEAQLIHMNGRAFDYNLGRFYGVDPIIQFPSNSQSLNGYSYLMNNPLAGTDPTGYVIWFAPAIPYVVGIIEGGGAAVAVYGAAETGTKIGTTIYDVGTGKQEAGQAITNAATEILVDRATDAVGGKIVKVADAVLPNATKMLSEALETTVAQAGSGKGQWRGSGSRF